MPITRRFRSKVDESLVYCHGGCEFNPPRRNFFLSVASRKCFRVC